MTREEAIETAPGSRSTYWADLVVSTVWSVGMLAGAVYELSELKVGLAAVSIACALIGVLGVIQTTHRLFFPQRAAIRARRLSTSRPFVAVNTAVSWLWFLIWVFFAISFFNLRSTVDMAWFTSLLFLMPTIRRLLLDASGERRPVEKIPQDFLSVEQTKPLQSHHWGEPPGSGHATSPQ